MRIILLINILATVWLVIASWTNPATGTMDVWVRNLELKKGSIYVAVYKDEAQFLKEKAFFAGKILKVESLTDCVVPFTDLPFGEYAVAVFHDLNNNQKLDRNIFGVPTEPYAFSNNPSVKWRSPTFAETKVQLQAAKEKVVIELKRWSNH